MKYRRDIDGLRAVAVVPVVLFHANVPGVTGGFVGVDIFFVISGFLITNILVCGFQTGSYSILEFYDRRARRLLPALLFMLMGATVGALLVLLPSELSRFAVSAAATALFSANILYWRDSNYFSAEAETNPLLHTWSLAVEEQFYIGFPIALYVVYKLGARKYLLPLIALAAALSLALAHWLTKDHAAAAFYLLPTRAWELLLGGILALLPDSRSVGRPIREGLGWGGLIMIGCAVFLYDPDVRFPGLAALLPCIGAAAIIYSGGRGPSSAQSMLSNPQLVGVGLISYSLYLWHWPIFVLSELYLQRELHLAETLVAVGASVAMAYVSWRYVERPFRRHGTITSVATERRTIVVAGGAIAVVVGGAAILHGGLAWRLPHTALELDRWSPPPAYLEDRCGGRTPDREDVLACISAPLASGKAGKIIVWGDSHAGPYADAAGAPAASANLEVRAASRAGCAPIIGAAPATGDGVVDWDCLEANDAILRVIASDPDVRTVIVAGRWARFYFPLDDPEAMRLVHASGELKGRAIEDSGLPAAITSSMNAVSAALRERDVDVFVVGQSPEFDLALPACLARARWHSQPDGVCTFKAATLPSGAHEYVVRHAAEAAGARYVSPYTALCIFDRCVREVGSQPVAWDTDHLSAGGAEHVLKQIMLTGALGPNGGEPRVGPLGS